MKIRVRGQVREVPEGMDVNEYVDKLDAIFAEAEEVPDPTSGMSGPEKFLAGAGRGMVNIGRNVGNLVGLVSDEEMADYEKMDQPLLDTGAGMAGNIVGEIAATAPITLGVGGAAQAARAARPLSKAVGMATAAPSVAAVDAGLSASLAGGPGNRMENLAQGAAIGGALSAPFKLLHKAGQKAVVPKTTQAHRTEHMLGSQIPLSQSAKPGIMKQVYEGWVANMPGAGGKLRGQYDKALENWRQFIVEEAMPKGADRVFKSSDDIQTVLSNVSKLWDDTFDYGFKAVPFKFFDDTWKPIQDMAKSKTIKKLWEKNKQAMGIPSLDNLANAKTLSGEELLSLKTEFQRVGGNLRKAGERNAANKMSQAVDSIHEVLKKNLDPTGKGKGKFAKEFRDYMDNLPQYKKWQDVLAAAEKGEASRFQPRHLLKATSKKAGKAGIAGKGVFNREAKNAMDALQPFPSKQGIFQSTAAMGLGSVAGGGTVGTLVGGPVGGAIGAATPFVVAKILARPGVQKMLAEGTPFSRRLMKAIKKRPDLFTAVGDQGIKLAVLAAEEGDK